MARDLATVKLEMANNLTYPDLSENFLNLNLESNLISPKLASIWAAGLTEGSRSTAASDLLCR